MKKKCKTRERILIQIQRGCVLTLLTLFINFHTTNPFDAYVKGITINYGHQQLYRSFCKVQT